MADVTDVQEYGRKFENQLTKLETADIDDSDYEAIRSFIRYEDTQSSVDTGTVVSHLNRLRLSAERSEISLTSMEKEDVDELLFTLKHNQELAEGTVRNYRKALRKFFQHQRKDWADSIKIGSSPDRNVDPNDLLDDDEIETLLNAAKQPRDKAAIAILADTGLRIGALASLRIRDFDSSGRFATVSINEEANVKGASGTVPVTWSRGYLANWLDIHPRRQDPDAALIHKLGNYYDGSDDGALTYQYLSRRIRKIGIEAGIGAGRLKTHNFRKSAISRWIREGLSEQVIKHRAHWVKDSSQFETYSGVTDEEINEEIASHYDLVDEMDTSRPALQKCPQCQAPLQQKARFCPGCGTPLTQEAAGTLEDAEDDIVASVADADQSTVNKILEFREIIKNDPEARKLLLNG